MFLQRITLCPVPNRADEVHRLAAEQVQDFQARGLAAALAEEVFGAGGEVVVASVAYDSLASLEETLAQLDSDAAYASRTARIGALLAEPVRVDLFRTLVPYPRPLIAGYVQRLAHAPIPGRAAEVRQALIDRVRRRHDETLVMALFERVSGDPAEQFVVAVQHDGLGALESYRERLRTDSSWAEHRRNLDKLLLSAPKQTVMKILLPAPALPAGETLAAVPA